MSTRKLQSVLSYRLDKQLGQAIVTLPDPLSKRRKDVLLGRHGSPESHAEYARILAEWEATGRRAVGKATGSDPTIHELSLRFWLYVKDHYRRPDGTPTSEVNEFRQTIRNLTELYGHMAAARVDQNLARGCEFGLGAAFGIGSCHGSISTRIKIRGSRSLGKDSQDVRLAICKS